MFQYFQPNPCGRNTGDCAVRAMCKALDTDWHSAHRALFEVADSVCDIENSNLVWGLLLKEHGFRKRMIPSDFADFCTAGDFCKIFRYGTYVLAMPGHVATVQDGELFDSWDSSNVAVLYFWAREE